jgi:hypothetical protein
MSAAFYTILNLAHEISGLADGLQCGIAYGRAEIPQAIRENLAKLTREREQLAVSGLPRTYAHDANARRLWEWQVNRALDDLLAALKEHIEAAKMCPEMPRLDHWNPDPELLARYNQAALESLQACQAAKAMEDDARRRLWDLSQQVDRTPAQKPPPATVQTPGPLQAERKVASTSASGADTKADKPKKRICTIPRNSDAVKLAQKLKKGRVEGRTDIDVAREFTEGNEQKAQSLLRCLRHYPDLLK